LINLAVVYLDDFGTDTVEKVTVMRHHQQTEVRTAKILFQPFGHVEIQMVGRLVQNQQIRFGNQSIGQSYPLKLSSGEMLHLLVKVPYLELRKYLFSLLFILPGLFMVHTYQQVIQSRMSFGFHAPFVLLYQLHGTVTMVKAGFQHGQFFRILRILFQIINPEVTAEHNIAAIISLLSGEYI